jgi:hypothetical protein
MRHMVYKFSPTSHTRSIAHQLLNPQRSIGFDDVRQLVLHAVLLAPAPQDTHWHTYVRVCVPTSMLCVGARGIPWRIICRYFFVCMLSKKKMRISEIHHMHFVGASPSSSYRRRGLLGRVSLLLHQKLNYCQIQYSVN